MMRGISGATRSTNRNTGRRSRSKPTGVVSSVAKTLFFNPVRSENIGIWRAIYQQKRLIRKLERLNLSTAVPDTRWTRFKHGLADIWHALVDELKAVATAAAFHLLTVVLIVVFNLAWFAFLIWLLGVVVFG